MDQRPRVHYYLIHADTGQRYAIGEGEVIVGRTRGDLLFPTDLQLGAQHCRLEVTARGLEVRDFGTTGGTFIDEVRVANGRPTIMRPGQSLRAGRQVFQLQDVSRAKRVVERRSRPRRPPPRRDRSSYLVVLALLGLALAALAIWFNWSTAPRTTFEALTSPFEMVDAELEAALTRYRELGREHDAGRVTGPDLARELRTNIVPAFRRVDAKFGGLKPNDERERRRLEVVRPLVTAVIRQTEALARSAEVPGGARDPAVSAELDAAGVALEAANARVRALKTQLNQ